MTPVPDSGSAKKNMAPSSSQIYGPRSTMGHENGGAFFPKRILKTFEELRPLPSDKGANS